MDPISGISGSSPITGATPGGGASGMPNSIASDEQGGGFGDVLREAVINRPTEAHHQADDLATKFAAGANIDPHQLAIATAKAGLEVQMATRTISQATTAIRTLMQMQI